MIMYIQLKNQVTFYKIIQIKINSNVKELGIVI